MQLDLYTVLIVSQFVISLCGLFFLAEYLREQSIPSRWFACAFILAPSAPIFYFAAIANSEWQWGYPVGNGVATMAVAFTWIGARSFNGRSTPWWIAIAAPWAMVLSVLLVVRDLGPWSGVIPFLLTFSLFSFLSASEFWRGADGEPRLRNSIILTATCAVNGLFYLCRALAYWQLGPEDSLFLAVFGAETATLVLMLLVIASSFSLILLGKERAQLTIRHAATHDGLTNVLNRGEFIRQASALMRQMSARPVPVAALLVDLDHFKKINDRFGHSAGDQVLTAFAGIAKASLRSGDILCRYGGEEFAVFLPHADADAAMTVAERIRMNFCAGTAPILKSVQPTASIGLAASRSAADFPSLIARADKALYLAKSTGRNRTVASGEIEESRPEPDTHAKAAG
ncbi:GGDEF domain-containing protein [Mesorhizobium sp. LHD-90]|uniref:GGDEF domain-containing protein n=1 Tax=Mesorhizobium sp. LHD-90 TaxID=3071414 RepID=UPI0027DEB44D|nr:GGDEF domain-containing protein [Mesorhizobium sp. LHD-90]MDQ6435586.1 GGDEF domain-containing protein [Mesorhizobium sp. LHD-90]